MDYNEIICNNNKLNPSFFPTGSALADPNYNIFPFLCQLLQVATDETIDPVLAMPKEYDISPHLTQYMMLSNFGDSRYPDSELVKAGLVEFLPKLITQIEVKQVGGSQIIDNYICNSDGVPIKESITVPYTTTIGTGGVNVYGYDIPAGLDPNELLKPFTADDVVNFVQDFIGTKINEAADYYIDFLIKKFPSSEWDVSMNAFKDPAFFYLILTNRTTSQKIYSKYHADSQDYVAKTLVDRQYIPANASVAVKAQPTFDDDIVASIYMDPVADYKQIMENSTLELMKYTTAITTGIL